MESTAIVVLGLYGLGILFVIVALIYLINKRLRDRKKETFEKRDF